MKTLFLSLVVSTTLLLVAFKAPKNPITSLKEMQKALKDGYSYVPSGSVEFNGKTVSCQGFFMMKTEVSNFDYKEYLFHLKNSGNTDAYNAALPDTSAWKHSLSGGEAFAKNYFNHPAFNTFPVVNLSKEQAEKYCDWLSTVWQQNTGNKSIKFRLPLHAEFVKAACGNEKSRPYAWAGPYLRNSKGCFQANFLNVGEGAITRNQVGKLEINPINYEKSDLMATVKSFQPNELGFFNLNGNVSEMIADGDFAAGGDWNSPGYDIRNESKKDFTKADPTVGFRPVMTFISK
jgi:formylglycine-generating enzyme required for sulfatase activity